MDCSLPKKGIKYMSKLTKFFKHPVRFFKDAQKKALYRKRAGELINPIFAFHVNDWKKPILQRWFPDRTFVFVPIKVKQDELKRKWIPLIKASRQGEVFSWGVNLPDEVKRLGKKVTHIEDGFIRSMELGAFHTPPLSLNFDTSAVYFDSSQPSDLEQLLANYNFDADSELMQRAVKLRECIVAHGISKYNHAAHVDIISVYGPKTKERILVIGQVEDDASIRYGCDKNYTNNDLVRIASLENPDAEIIYKPHPDVLNRKRQFLSDPEEVKDIASIIYSDIPLTDAFETIDRVYTITSQAGIEALIRGIPVTTLGCPFYAGWGITDDRQQNPRRNRTLTVDQVFAASFILYPRYFSDVYKRDASPEEIVEHIIKAKKLRAALLLNQQIERKSLYAFHVNDWKRDFLNTIFDDKHIIYLPFKITDKEFTSNWLEKIKKDRQAEILVWGMNAPGSIKAAGKKITYVEDGFVRSVGLGSARTLPFSLNFDTRTPYFNAQEPSDLETLLNTYDFKRDPELLDRARVLMEKILALKMSKYNHAKPVSVSDIYGPKQQKRVLVVGQVEDDASILYGSNKRMNNNDLVHCAFMENPDAHIIYKPHPDVLAGRRKHLSNSADVAHIAQIVDQSLSIADALETIDHVYTITSQVGFEALLRNIHVTTFGCPFYAGWGLTDDRQLNSRRQTKLSVLELFAGSYLLYPQYFNPYSKERISAEEAIGALAQLIAAHNSYTPPDESAAHCADGLLNEQTTIISAPNAMPDDTEHSLMFTVKVRKSQLALEGA